MQTVSVSIVNPVDINRQLIDLERARGGQIVRFALLMERAEGWAIDDIRTDSSGMAIAVNDERGTAEERLLGVMRLQQLINSSEFAEHLKRFGADEEPHEVDELLIEVMALLKTGRFMVCLTYIP